DGEHARVLAGTEAVQRLHGMGFHGRPAAPPGDQARQPVHGPRAARELVSAARAADQFVAAAPDRAGRADLAAVREAQAAQRAGEGPFRVRRGLEGTLAEGAAGAVGHGRTGSARSSALRAAPTAIAKGKMKATTAVAVRHPRSLTIMKKF